HAHAGWRLQLLGARASSQATWYVPLYEQDALRRGTPVRALGRGMASLRPQKTRSIGSFRARRLNAQARPAKHLEDDSLSDEAAFVHAEASADLEELRDEVGAKEFHANHRFGAWVQQVDRPSASVYSEGEHSAIPLPLE